MSSGVYDIFLDKFWRNLSDPIYLFSNSRMKLGNGTIMTVPPRKEPTKAGYRTKMGSGSKILTILVLILKLEKEIVLLPIKTEVQELHKNKIVFPEIIVSTIKRKKLVKTL